MIPQCLKRDLKKAFFNSILFSYQFLITFKGMTECCEGHILRLQCQNMFKYWEH